MVWAFVMRIQTEYMYTYIEYKTMLNLGIYKFPSSQLLYKNFMSEVARIVLHVINLNVNWLFLNAVNVCLTLVLISW